MACTLKYFDAEVAPRLDDRGIAGRDVLAGQQTDQQSSPRGAH
jgi:hypothetical protein